MTPADAIGAGELAEAEIRYRNQLAADMYARVRELAPGRGLRPAVADVKAVQRGLVLDTDLEARRRGPGSC